MKDIRNENNEMVFDEDYDLELSYQYGYGVMNISPLTISNQEPYWKQYAGTY